jgi:hypothetical protein
MKFVKVLAIVIFMSCACFGQSARQIAQTAFKSVVLLEMSDSQGQPVSLGSGFFIADGIIATNAHVIEGAASGTAKLIGSEKKFTIHGIVALDRHADLALLKIDISAPALNLGLEEKPVVGDKVYVVGNPLGLEGTFSEGIVSGIRSIKSDSILQMTAPISPGSSGGPVMNDTGIVIGVAEATFKNGQNLNLAVPVTYLSKMWGVASQHLTVIPLAEQPSHNSDQSIVDGIGARIETGIIISGFTLTKDYLYNTVGFEMRITNNLPHTISGIRLRIIYHDVSNAIMDFENFTYNQAIPPGLTKTVIQKDSQEAKRAHGYYEVRDTKGLPLSGHALIYGYDSNWNPVKTMEPKVEIRILKFDTDEAQ